MVEARNMAVARAEHGRAIEQRFRFDLPPVPEQVEPLGEIGLRKAWIELKRHIERCQRFVILMGQAQGPSKCAVAKAIELIECDAHDAPGATPFPAAPRDLLARR